MIRGFRWGPAALLALVAVLVSLGMAPPAARAADADFVFTGRGWGSGVGMSQWGAWEAAKEGKDFRFILGFYYPGLELGQTDDPDLEMNVKISSEPWLSLYSQTQDYVQVDLAAVVTPLTLVKHASSGDAGEQIPVGTFFNVWLEKDGAVYVYTSAGGRQGPYEWIEARPADGTGRVKMQLKARADSGWLAPREFWGKMRVQPSSTSGCLNCFNKIPLEKYLRSIGEVEYDWAQPTQPAYALEAVKAQAVAARSYAVTNNDPYINDNQYDQAYLGYFARGYVFEDKFPGIPQAAEETAGIVMWSGGRVVSAQFSAHSGGYTTSWAEDTYPYYSARPDPFSLLAPPLSLDSAGPGFNWTCRLSQKALSDEVNGMDDVDGDTVQVGTLNKVEVLSRDTTDPTSHARTLKLTGTGGTAVIRADDLRRALGYETMRSTLILSITNPAEQPPLPAGEFRDVGREHLYYKQIKQAADAMLVSGYSDGTFRPENSVSRWQFAKISVLLHNLYFPGSRIVLADVTGNPFWDVWAKPGLLGDESDWVSAALQAGIIAPDGATSFHPYQAIRRDEMATMLVRALSFTDEAAALPASVSGFGDIPATDPHFLSTRYLKSLGVLLGYADPAGGAAVLLRPAEPIKRMHVAVILCRLLDLPH
jgi:stage II sporulation protein D